MKKRVLLGLLVFVLVIGASGCDKKKKDKEEEESGFRCVACGSSNVHAGVDNVSTGIRNFWCYDCGFTWATYRGNYAGGHYERLTNYYG